MLQTGAEAGRTQAFKQAYRLRPPRFSRRPEFLKKIFIFLQ